MKHHLPSSVWQAVTIAARGCLPIPAHAEIVLEGELVPTSQETLPEGPFAEFLGYYAADRRPGPIMACGPVRA